MAVYYKFKSAKDYDSITIDGHFISVANLKERIFESKHLGRGTDFDLVVTNAQTNEEYLDEAMLIPKNTSVLIRRVPGRPRMTIVTQPDEPKVETEVVDDQLANSSNFMTADSSVMNNFEASDFEDLFGNELYATIPEVPTGQSNNPMQDSAPPSKADEESKLKAFLDNSGLDWQRQGGDGFGQGRGFARGGRGGGRGFGRGIGLERKTPPQGYVCHRCKVPGHFIQHCPTNGDPTFDLRKVKPPTGIPKSMLVPTPDGLYSLPSGTSAVLKPNEAAFEKEIEGLPSTRSMGDLPPELHCPLCKEVMKDAVLTSKCCFRSFCDKCIRDHIISKSMCVCGANNILADDLLPNKTVRDTINRILESGNSSADNVGSAAHVQDMESARCLPPKIPSPTQSAASKGEQKIPPVLERSPIKEVVNGNQANDAPLQLSQPQNSAKEKIIKVPDVSEATHESASVKEHVSHSNVLPVEEEVQQKVAASDAGKKKKKKKKMPMPSNGAEMPWTGMGMQPAMDGYGGPANFNPYWQGGMQPPMDGYMGPFPGNMPYNMGYGPGPMDMPFNMGYGPGPMDMHQNFMFPPQMMPPPPQRDLAAEFGMGMNFRPPPMLSREELEARNADLRRKREMERRFENRELPPRDHDFREGSSNANPLPMKSKPKPLPIRRSPSPDRYDDRDRDRERDRPHDRYRERERSRDRSSVDYDRERERERERERDRDRENHYRRSSHSHRSDRISPERRDKEISRLPPKRKAEHLELDHDIDRPREREREREHDRERTHRHRSESRPPATTAESAAAAAQAALDKKHKASVFSRISFPEEELPKMRKVSDEPKPKSKSAGKDHETGGSGPGSGSGHHHQKRTATTSSMANGYHDHETVKKSVMAAMEYESSDDERHFKRKPSRYEPSPPPREELDETAGRRHRKHR